MQRELVHAVLANEALIAVTGQDRAARVSLLDRTVSLLTENQARVVRVGSPDDQPLDLQRVMDQVVGHAQGTSNADRVERFFGTIALPIGSEKRIVLIVDDAHTMTPDMLSYLALIGPTTAEQDLRLQIVFAGTDALWARLPRTGNLSGERIAARFTLDAARPVPRTAPARPVEPELVNERLAESQAADAHTALRRQLAQAFHQREARQVAARRIGLLVLTGLALIVVVGATVILWKRLPGFRETIQALVA